MAHVESNLDLLERLRAQFSIAGHVHAIEIRLYLKDPA